MGSPVGCCSRSEPAEDSDSACWSEPSVQPTSVIDSFDVDAMAVSRHDPRPLTRSDSYTTSVDATLGAGRR